jgi:co-chaperonin GroES (HSP10)
MQPYANRVIIELTGDPNETRGGIALPDNAQIHDGMMSGKVTAVGPGRPNMHGNLMNVRCRR